MPSRQINDFFTKRKQKKIELVSRPGLEQVAPVSAAAMERSGNYRSCYDNIVKFQILDEIEALFDLRVDCGGEGLGKRLQDLFVEWSARMSYSQASLSNHEQVLKVRRTLLEIYIERINRSGHNLNSILLTFQNQGSM